MSNSKFVTPEPAYTLIQREDEGAPVYAAVNTPLASLKAAEKKLYPWQLSLVLKLETEDDKGLTLPEEEQAIAPFCQQLDLDLRAKGNALPLARITWKKGRELLFRVNNPVVADELIKAIIESEEHPRPFNYFIDHDEQWDMAEDYLKQFKSSAS